MSCRRVMTSLASLATVIVVSPANADQASYLPTIPGVLSAPIQSASTDQPGFEFVWKPRKAEELNVPGQPIWQKLETDEITRFNPEVRFLYDLTRSEYAAEIFYRQESHGLPREDWLEELPVEDNFHLPHQEWSSFSGIELDTSQIEQIQIVDRAGGAGDLLDHNKNAVWAHIAKRMLDSDISSHSFGDNVGAGEHVGATFEVVDRAGGAGELLINNGVTAFYQQWIEDNGSTFDGNKIGQYQIVDRAGGAGDLLLPNMNAAMAHQVHAVQESDISFDILTTGNEFNEAFEFVDRAGGAGDLLIESADLFAKTAINQTDGSSLPYGSMNIVTVPVKFEGYTGLGFPGMNEISF